MNTFQQFSLFSKKSSLFLSIIFLAFLINMLFVQGAKASIEEISTIDFEASSTSGCSHSLLVDNQKAYINSPCKGDILVYDLSNQGNLALADSISYRDLEIEGLSTLRAEYSSLAIESSKLYLGAGSEIFVFDITDPNNVTKDSVYSFPETPRSEFGIFSSTIATQGTRLYALSQNALTILDITDSSNISELGSIYNERYNGQATYLEVPSNIVIDGNTAFVQVNRVTPDGLCLVEGSEQGGLAVYDVTSPGSIAELAFKKMPGISNLAIDTSTDVAYTIEADSSTDEISLVSYDLTTVSSISELERVSLVSAGLLALASSDLHLDGSNLFVSSPINNTILRFDISNPSQMELVSVISDDSVGGDATRLTHVSGLDSESNKLYAVSNKEQSLSEFTFDSSPTVIDPPRIVSISPNSTEGPVGTTSNIVITFDKTIVQGPGNIKIGRDFTLFNDKAGILDQVINASSSNVVVSGSTVTVSPPDAFLPGSRVQVHIDDSAFRDEQDLNAFGKVFYNSDFQVTGDTTNPEVCFFSPTPGGVMLDPCQKLSLVFEELSISKGTGNITIRRSADDSLVEEIPVTSSNVVVEDSLVTIEPSTNLSIEDSVYVTIDDTAFRDASGNLYEGISDSTWTFSGLGNDAPLVQAYTPSPGETTANFNDGIVIDFNKTVQKANGDIHIRNFSDDSLVETIDVNSNQVLLPYYGFGEVVIFPSSNLPDSTQLYIQIDNGAFTDTNNNAFAGLSDKSWEFTGSYEDEVPVDINLSPAFTSYNVDLNTDLEITFSENVTAGAGAITIRRASDATVLETILASSGLVEISNNFVTIDPSTSFSSESSITIDVDEDAFVDGDANDSIGIEDWQLSANGDDTSLELTQLSPEAGEQLDNLNTSYILTFEEDIAKATGSIYFRRLSDDKALDSLLVSSSRVQVSDNQMIILPEADLSNELGIYITVDSGAITNVGATKTYEGISHYGHEWYVKAKGQYDGQGGLNGGEPQIISYNPEPDSYNVDYTQTFSLEMDEEIQKGTGNILVRRHSNGDLLELIPLSSSDVTVNGTVFEFKLTEDLTNESKIYIEIPKTAILDLDDNQFSGVDAEEWTLSSGADLEAPEYEALMPNIADQGVDLNKNFVIIFNEAIQKINGDILIKEFTTNTTIQSIPVSSSSVSVTGNVLSIDHSLTVSNDATLYVEISGTSFEDLVGNNFAGLSEGEWFFTGNTSDDDDGPNVIVYTPEIGSNNNDFDSEFSLKFDENIEVDQGFILIKDSSDDSLIAQFDIQSLFVTVQGDTLTLDPDISFEGRSSIYVQVTENAIQDSAGNHFAGIADESWYFRGSEQGSDDDDDSSSNGISINAEDQTHTSKKKAKFSFTVTRDNADQKIRCRATFSGIKHKKRKFRFRRGVSSKIVRYKIGKKQLRKLRREGSEVNVGIQAFCSDGSSASTTVNISL